MECNVAISALGQTLYWWSGGLAFAVAVIAGLAAFARYGRELKARDWDRAHGAYERFLDVALANPEFRPGYWSDEASSDPLKRNKYRWFMARFLWAAEQVLLAAPKARDQWKRVLKVMLREHADFLADPAATDEVQCYYGPLKDLIDDAIAEKHAQAGGAISRASTARQ